MQHTPFYGFRAYALPPDGGGRVGGWAVLHDGCGGALEGRERFLEANKKCVTHSDLGSAACRLPAGAGVGTVAEMVVEGVEYVIRLASRAGAT